MLVKNIVEGGARRFGNRVAVIHEGEHITYSQLNRRSNAVAHALAALGVQVGERVAVVLPNRPEFLYAYFALSKLGAVIVPLNTHLAPPEIAFIVEHSGSVAVVYCPDTRAALSLVPPQVHRFVTEAAVGAETDLLPGLVEGGAPDPTVPVREASPMGIFYTSGSTGDTKAVVLTNRSVARCAAITVPGLDVQPDEVGFMVIPMYHTSLHMMAFPTFLTGAQLIIHEGFNATESIELMATHGATTYVCVTSTAVLTLKAAQQMGGSPLSSLRKLLVGGSPIPPALIGEWKSAVPAIDVYAIYGLTEMAPSVARVHGEEAARKPGSVGRPYDGIEVRIVDGAGADMPPGTAGEICLRSPTMMQGYWRNPAATAEAIVDGWLHTGDVGYVDDEDCLFLVDRIKNVIKRGGVTIYPSEVEAILYKHDAIQEVAVVGLSDPVMGEVVTAVIALKPHRELDAAGVVQHCLIHLARFKAPEFVSFRDELPKNGTGKVWTRGIRDALEKDRSDLIDCRGSRRVHGQPETANIGTAPP